MRSFPHPIGRRPLFTSIRSSNFSIFKLRVNLFNEMFFRASINLRIDVRKGTHQRWEDERMSSPRLQGAQQNHTAEKRSVEDSANAQTPFEDMIWQVGLKLKGGRWGHRRSACHPTCLYCHLPIFSF